MTARRFQVLEIGTSHLACGGFASKSGRLVLEYWDHEPIEPEWATNLEQFDQLLPKLATFATRQPKRASTLLLPGHMVLTKIIPRPPNGGTLLDPAEHIPLALDEVIWDWREFDGGGMARTVLIAAARRVHVEKIWEVVAEAGLTIDRVMPAAAAMLACRAAGHPAAAVASSDRRSTLLAAIAGEQRLVRTIPLGTWQAEEETGRLMREIGRTLAHWTKTFGLPVPQTLNVCGIELSDTFETGLPFRVERYDVGAEIEPASGTLVPKSLRPELVGAVRAIGQHPSLLIDLSTDSLVRERIVRKRSRMRFAAAALVVLALVPPLLFHRVHAAETMRRAQAMERDLQAVTALHAANAGQLRELGQIQARSHALAPAWAARDSWSRFLSELQDRLAEMDGAWVERLQVVANGRAANSDARRLVLAGRLPAAAAPAPERARQLLRRLAVVTFVAALEDERFENAEDGALKFAVTLVLKTDVVL